jgi:RHS repeat-associated protein
VYTSPGSCAQSYKFTGYERDAETGLDYAFARYYNPRLARFMSVDPLAGDVGDPQSLNRYAYVQNNSTNFTDPTGMFIAVQPPAPPPPPPFGPVYTGGGGGSIFEPSDPKDCEGGCKPTWPDQKRRYRVIPVQQQSPCEDIAGKGGVVDATFPYGRITLAFNSGGFLTGFSVPLTGRSARTVGDVRIPANTRVGVRLDGLRTITIASNNPLSIGRAFGATISSATFSEESFTAVTGNIAVLGMQIPSTSSSVLDALNENASAISMGKGLLGLLEFTSTRVSCETLLGR